MISIKESRQRSPGSITFLYNSIKSGNRNRLDKKPNKIRQKKWAQTARATDEEIFLSRLRSTRVRLNVGGECHEVMWKTLKRMPFTRLGLLRKALTHDKIMEICDDYDLKKNEYYFDRHPKSFLCVLTMFRTGNLHMAEDLCIVNFADDLEYWGINENLMESCCHHRYHMKRERANDEIKKVKDIHNETNQIDQFGTTKFDHCRRKLWDLVENPQTSISAQIIAVISVMFILISIICLMISTLPRFQTNDPIANMTGNLSVNDSDFHPLEMIEIVCIIWFTFEYVCRLFSCPNKKNFLKSPMNMIDILAILPYYISIIFTKLLHNQNTNSLISVRKVVQVFRILRVLRILKLARHSTGLQALGYTLQKSYKELGMLVMFIALGVLLFSSLIYFAEKDDAEKKFVSIPATFWWAIITMTTVGYGDMVPNSALGKFIGSFCCICGVLVIAMPIPIIVNNFEEFYKDQLRREKTLKRREDMAKAKEQGSIVSTKSDDENSWDLTFGSDEESESLMKKNTSQSQFLKPRSFSEFFKNDSISSICKPIRPRTASFNEIPKYSIFKSPFVNQNKPKPENQSFLNVPQIQKTSQKPLSLNSNQIDHDIHLELHKKKLQNRKDNFFKENIHQNLSESPIDFNHQENMKDTIVELLPGNSENNLKTSVVNIMPKSRSSSYLKVFPTIA